LKTAQIEAKMQASMDLKKMDQAFGFQNIDMKGLLKMNVIAKGKYDKANAIFPITKGMVSLKNATIQTQYYPHPIQNINLVAAVTNGKGTFKETKVLLNPASFVFEGKPIYVNASFENFDDVAYKIKAKGELDLVKIYKVFSRKGLGIKGFIKADVAFEGKQSDAINGHYDKLKNSGTLQLKNISTTSEYLPKPFVINDGLFTFQQDKMHFTDFNATYGQSDFKMNGYLQNVINFVLSEKEVLKGKFSLAANYINVDEFMSGATPSSEVKTSEKPTQKAATGVIVIPANFDLQFLAKAQKVNFNDLALENTKGDLTISNGKLTLKNTGFNLIGCQVDMDAIYGSESPTKAFFDFNIKANDFDIKRAYDEIKMFREMASAAEKAQGIVSLNYTVGGKLDENMQPIYPSLVGGGTLSVKDVKMRGFKMFGAVSSKTGTEEIKNPDVTKVDINTKIKNNIITIERFKFKFAGFRPRIEGTTSFDGKLNLKMRLGLPPLGIIGIPLTITGTKDDPKVKLGRKTEDLQETEYVDTPQNRQPVKTEAPAPEVKKEEPKEAK
jgi:AsmA protein